MEPIDLLVKLSTALDDRAKDVAECHAWYVGQHPTPPPPANTFPATDREARAAFDTLSRLAITNMLPPIVDTPAAKLRVEGFRFSETSTATDAEAWAIWQRNHLDADSDLGNFTALQTGQQMALVWADTDGRAMVTVEDPAQAIIAYEAGSRRRRAAGLKRWVAEDDHLHATLYLPGAIYKFRSVRRVDEHRRWTVPESDKWAPREVPGEAWPLPNPLGVVPLVEGRVNAGVAASRFGGGKAEFDKQITYQRQLNNNVMALLTTMEHQAFRQRWIIGWEPPVLEDGKTPDRHALLKAAASDLWVLNGHMADDAANIRVGEFSQADLRPFVDVNREIVKAMAATSATPPYAFLLGDMVNVAADSLARIEGSLIAKVQAHARNLGEFWEEVLSLALRVENNPKANDPATSVVWADFVERTATEQANLAKTANELGAPKTAVFAMLPNIDQTEAQRWVTQSRADALFNRAANTPPTPPV